jgi:glutamyl-tRNA reductase
MSIVCVGMNHATAHVSVRERLAFPRTSLKQALARFAGEDSPPWLPDGQGYAVEGVILSTCNRLEVYAVAPDLASGRDTIARFLADSHAIDPAEFVRFLYAYADADAVSHLFAVSAGLDSLVLGEAEVLGQVAEALEAALSQATAGPVLSALFRAAVRAGKRARTETAIGRGAVSVGSVAVELARTVLSGLEGKSVLVLGAGEMGELAVRHLMSSGVDRLVVASRTYDRALALADTWGGQALTFDRISEALAGADILLVATGAPHALVSVERVTQALAARPDRPLLVIDIAVPRNVDPAVARLPGVRLFDIDDLQATVEEHLAERRREVPRVEAILAKEVQSFMTWYRSLDVVPTLAELRERLDHIRQAELDRALRRLGPVGERERHVIELLSERIVNQILHAPTVRLKQNAANGNGGAYSQALRELFALGETLTYDE